MAQTAVASVSIHIGGSHVLVGSCVGSSVLLKAAHVEVEVEEMDVTAVVQDDNQMDYDDEDGGLCLNDDSAVLPNLFSREYLTTGDDFYGRG
jgi:hypothetical protein